MKSVMSHNFATVPKSEIQRSTFNRSHGAKTTFDAGWLVPVYNDEVLPGDTFSLNMSAFARLATPIHPVMDNMYLDSFFFFVPLRLVWDNFQKFMGERRNPSDSTDFLIPQIVSPVGGYASQTIYDYMGIPTLVPGLSHSALYLRAYNLIYNEWFRDQNLQNSVASNYGDGPDAQTDYVLLRRGKRHDYFSSCLPFPQKGPAVTIPLGTTAPVLGIAGITGGTAGATAAIGFGTSPTDPWPVGSPHLLSSSATVNGFTIKTQSTGAIGSGNRPQIFADLTNATAATINQVRQAFQVQRLYERDARGGTRYTEIIRSHFNTISPDSRLQRPEYLGGGSTPVNIHPVPQNSATGVTPQGNLAAFGTVSATGHGFTKSFTEHGIILGLVSVRADLTYQDGLNRAWSRRTRLDFYWPALAHLGEQAVLNKEIYAQGSANPTADAGVFGYQEVFAEYRYKPSQITGKFRSNTVGGSLDSWILTQDFASLPALNASFIVEDPPIDRVIAVPAEPHFIFDSYFNLKCARPMPVYGVPGLIDHF